MNPFQALRARAIQKGQPLSAQLELTHRCNQRCGFCYNPPVRRGEELSAAEWDVVIADLRVLGTLTVCLTGGEPLCHPQFFDIARAVRGRAMALKIFTNGSLIDHDMAGRIGELKPASVEMSLHGAYPETHDRMTGKPGSHAMVLRAAVQMRSLGIRVALKTPLTSANEHEFDELRRLAEECGTQWVVDCSLTPRDDGDRAPLAYQASRPALDGLMQYFHDRGQLERTERTPGGVNCGAGAISVAVDPEGNVFPCIQWRQHPVGNVRAARLKDIWFGSLGRKAAISDAVTANARLIEAGGPVSRFPFCPGLAHLLTGDPFAFPEEIVDRAEAAERARCRNGKPSSEA